MRNRLKDFGGINNSFVTSKEDYLPQEHMFALGVDNEIQILDMMALRNSMIGLSDFINGNHIVLLFLKLNS